MDEKVSSITHELKMLDRSILSLTGVTKIISFDSTEFIIDSNMGAIHITGEKLELLSLDTHEGQIKIKGKIFGFNYIEKPQKKHQESIIAKLFK